MFLTILTIGSGRVVGASVVSSVICFDKFDNRPHVVVTSVVFSGLWSVTIYF